MLIFFIFLVTINCITSRNETENFTLANGQEIYIMSIGFNAFQIPNKETFYACKYFNVGNITNSQTGNDNNTKYHAIEFEPHVGKYVHHMVIFGCPQNFSLTLNTSEPFDCTQNPMQYCSLFRAGWLPGMDPIKLPNETGMIWGTEDTKYVMLQVHYYNPGLDIGYKDSSYINVYFIPKLRQYDTGLMLLGKNAQAINIPPGMSNYTITSICSSGCSFRMKGKIFVYGFLSHGHLTARSITSKFSDKNGTFIADLGEQEYSFDRQVLRVIEPVALESGFQALTTCVYNTLDRGNNTHGGLGSYDEMCVNAFVYYPKENGLQFCFGSGEFECM
jgi:dopamine beta-monooxygenase